MLPSKKLHSIKGRPSGEFGNGFAVNRPGLASIPAQDAKHALELLAKGRDTVANDREAALKKTGPSQPEPA
jgi:hypothetical protein